MSIIFDIDSVECLCLLTLLSSLVHNRITFRYPNPVLLGDYMDEYLTPRQAAERKGVSVPTIYKAIERGVLPSERVLDRVAVRIADVDAYQPGSYGGIKRTVRKRGPGRGPKQAVSVPTSA